MEAFIIYGGGGGGVKSIGEKKSTLVNTRGKNRLPPTPQSLLKTFEPPPPSAMFKKTCLYIAVICSYNCYNACNVTFVKKVCKNNELKKLPL